MKRISFITFILIAMFIHFETYAQKLPNIKIIATGGTIAGTGASADKTNYKPGQVMINDLIESVPQIKKLANITGEQLVKIGSQDMTDDVWLKLAHYLNKILSDNAIDGVVITHGTDTMEETAYFLNLTVKSDKPIVLVGAMRPSTSLSADGPLNLYNAVVTAIDKKSYGKGVLVVMNGLILPAHGVVKMNTTDVQAFQAPNSGALGYVFNGKAFYNMTSTKIHTKASIFNVDNLQELPKVGIIYSYANIEKTTVEILIKEGYHGLVYAGVGNGNIHKNVFPTLVKASESGFLVVRASRVPTGPVTLDAEIDDAQYGFIASQELNPPKARILLMLALTQTKDYKTIQQYFNTY